MVTDSGRRVLVVTPDVLQPAMAGPAIRAFEMAMALAKEHVVELVSTVACELTHPDLEIRHVDDAGLRRAFGRADIIIVQGWVVAHHPWVVRSDKVLVVDLYDPFHLETLEQAKDLGPSKRGVVVRRAVETVNAQLERGDFFLCASAKQRDFWLGHLASVGRINPATYDRSGNLDDFVVIVPFGVGDDPPRSTRPVLKGVVPGIGADDKVVLWGGGVYNWFDPLTLLQAVDRVRHRVPEVRLYFLGLEHPNPRVPTMHMANEARELAGDLGMVGTHVFFNHGWVDYDDRQNYLLEADLGVSTHLDHLETAFSFRTRVLDYLWAGLPVVATAGDSFSDVIDSRGLGATVPAGDVGALTEALVRLLTVDALRADATAAIAAYVPELRWSRALAPLLEFCRAPRPAADRVPGRERLRVRRPMLAAMTGRRRWWRAPLVLVDHVRHREWAAIRRGLLGRSRS